MQLSLYRFILLFLFLFLPSQVLSQPTVVIGNNGPTINVGLGASSAKYATLAAAVTDFGSTVGTLIINTASFSPGSSPTVPSTMTLKFENAGTLSCGSTTVTIQSSTINWPGRQIFDSDCSSTGSVSFSGNTSSIYLSPLWWGCLGDDSTDNAACFTAIGVAATNRQVRFPKGDFRSSVALGLTGASTELICEGDTNLKFTAATDGVTFGGSSYHQRIKNCTLWSLHAGATVALNIGDGTNTINDFESLGTSVWTGSSGKWAVGYQLRKVQSSNFRGGFIHGNLSAGITKLITIDALSRAVQFDGVNGTGNANGTTTTTGIESRGDTEWTFTGGTIQGGFSIAAADIDCSNLVCKVTVFGTHFEQTAGAGTGILYDNSIGVFNLVSAVNPDLSIAPAGTAYGLNVLGGLIGDVTLGTNTRAAYFAPAQLDGTLTNNSGVGTNVGNYRVTGNTTANAAMMDLIGYSKPESVVIADDGAGTSPSATYTPVRGKAEVNCQDANGCTLVMGETGMVTGRRVIIVVVSSNTVTVGDTAGVTELSGAFVMGLYDTLCLDYRTDRWVQVCRNDN